jgi:hypothetical protein
MRRRDFRGAVAAEITVAHIIRHDDYDVGTTDGLSGPGGV